MVTIYLRFSDRAEALATLAAVLGHVGSAAQEDGREMTTSGWFAGTRYDLCFLSDHGVPTSTSGEHVNFLWWGTQASAPDFGASLIAPQTPRCCFAL